MSEAAVLFWLVVCMLAVAYALRSQHKHHKVIESILEDEIARLRRINQQQANTIREQQASMTPDWLVEAWLNDE